VNHSLVVFVEFAFDFIYLFLKRQNELYKHNIILCKNIRKNKKNNENKRLFLVIFLQNKSIKYVYFIGHVSEDFRAYKFGL